MNCGAPRAGSVSYTHLDVYKRQALGLRYLAGADHEEGFCTRKQAEEACREAGLARADFYYPVPDHRMQMCIRDRLRAPENKSGPAMQT